MVDQDAQHGRLNRLPARHPDREHGVPVADHERRRHVAARALPGLGEVGVALEQRLRIEVGHLVVEEEPVTGHHHPAAAHVRAREADRVAPPVDDRHVVGGAHMFDFHLARSAGRAGRVVRRGGIAGGHRSLHGGVADEAAALVGVALREQFFEGDVDEARVADVASPIGEGKLGGLDQAVQGERPVGAREVEALEDVERLAHRRAAALGRGSRVDVVAAIAHPGRGNGGQLVSREVGERHLAGAQRGLGRVLASVRGERRVLNAVYDRPRDRPAVEGGGASLGDQLVRPRQIGVAKEGADGIGLEVLVEVQLAARGERLEAICPGERAKDHEPLTAYCDRRLQRSAQRDRPIALQRPLPDHHCGGDTD